jgi:RyR domain
MNTVLTMPLTGIVSIAKVCHQANKAFCEVNGDLSQRDWEYSEEWQVDSTVKGVRLRLENPEASDSGQHEAWSAEKKIEGWKYGPVKDVKKKEHPCLVPFDELPEFQQKKDKLFCAIVDALK